MKVPWTTDAVPGSSRCQFSTRTGPNASIGLAAYTCYMFAAVLQSVGISAK